MNQIEQDQCYMAQALDLAAHALGATWPNPAVGCILVADGIIVGRGVTAVGGRPHAETQALAEAGARSRGAVAYVTLEPCNHQGVTGPCSEALIAADVARVVVACRDPDGRVAGAGIARLVAAGIPVAEGVLAARAQALNEGFFCRIRQGRPLVTVKLASSLDGRIATSTGESRWITGEQARTQTHRLRAHSDAIMVGSGTALADDPALTCRMGTNPARPPVRIVVDGRARLPLAARLVTSAPTPPTWVMVREDAGLDRRKALGAAAVEVMIARACGDHLDLTDVLARLGARGVTRLLVEGGGGLVAALARARLIDYLIWFRASLLIGGDGIAAVAPLPVSALDEAPRFTRVAVELVGEDIMETYCMRR